MSDSFESVPMQTALVGLEMDAETAHYVGILEGTISNLVIEQAKFRAFLELLTGDAWDGVKIDSNGVVLQKISVDALVKQTGMNRAKATLLVARRWSEHNLPMDAVVTKAVPIADMVAGESGTTVPKMSDRLAKWKARQISDADEMSSAPTEFVPVTPVKPVAAQDISIDVRE